MNALEVQYRGERVGLAVPEKNRDEFAFEYAPEWLAHDEAFPISANLPLRRERFEAPRAHPCFANLLPEGAAREAICGRLGVSPDNDVALLGALGGDTAGALQFTPVDPVDDASRRRREIVSALRSGVHAGLPKAAPLSSSRPETPPFATSG
jgi:HipA-like protein